MVIVETLSNSATIPKHSQAPLMMVPPSLKVKFLNINHINNLRIIFPDSIRYYVKKAY